MQFKINIFILFLFSASSAFSQGCDSLLLNIVEVRANDTDNNIPWELSRHYTFFNPDCVPKNKLLVHLVGTIDNPSSTQLFTSLAANHGFHVLSLKYKNNLSAQTACNSSTDVDCHFKFRREIIEGVDYSPEVEVDSVNAIYNRLLRLLHYMDSNYPTQNWGQYFSGNNINWNKIIVSGHSQGGGHAAVIGITQPLIRVLMFASPNDYSNHFNQVAPWTNLPHVAADSAYYSFNNINDLVSEYNTQYTAALNIGVGLFGDTVSVDNTAYPYQLSHNLYTSIDSSGFTVNHGMVVIDNNVPLDSNGKPIFEEVWKYMLGIDCPLSGTPDFQTSDYFTLFPNPTDTYVNVVVNNDYIGEEIFIYDTAMKLQKRIFIEQTTSGICIQSLANGLYFVKIAGEVKPLVVR